jgi:thymidylate synthase
MSYGDIFHDEDVCIREIMGLNVKVTSPKLTDEFVEKHGDPKIILHTLKKFDRGAVMHNRPFTYGQCIYDKRGVDQFRWMVNRLVQKPETKSATICLLTEGISEANLPCLTTLDAKIRNGFLNMQFFFRSQNVLGRQYANLLAIANLQHKLCQEVGVEVGFLSGYIASAHIYEYDWDTASALVKGDNVKVIDRFYDKGPASIRQNKLFRS